MRAFRTMWWLLLGCWLAAVVQADEFPQLKNTEKAAGDPMPPAEVIKTAKLPPGFELGVFAAEPDVQNPIAITTDARGRVWVAENFSWAGSGSGGFDPQQRDRIVVLSDTDGDGKHDRRTVFWDEARKLTSVEVDTDGVWAICLPNLIYIPDKNHDDVPDGPPIVVLDGLNEGVVGHTPANGLKWGPDGWLYARHGIQATSALGKPGDSPSQRVNINTGVWRYHPTRHVVEAVMHGMTNSWGFDFTDQGEMFVINTVIGHLWHVVPGSHTQRMYGVDLMPNTYHLINQVADHVHWDTGETWDAIHRGVTDRTSAAGGGHAHIGLMIYQGDNWPAEYRGGVFTLNLHGRRINWDRLERENAGYTAKHGSDFCFIADPWFRGMDLITGPDGGVLIADWSDTGECHDHDGVHRTSGRIYKLTYGKPAPVAEFDLTKKSDAELLALQSHANDWYSRQARRLLQQRHEQPGSETSSAKDTASVPANAPAVRQLWTRWVRGQLGSEELLKLLADPDEHVRVWAVRLLAENWQPNAKRPAEAELQALRNAAAKDPSGLVLLYIASALQRLAPADRWSIAEPLAARSDFAYDRMYPLMLWYAVEPAVAEDSDRGLALLKSTKISLLRQHLARRLIVDIDQRPDVADAILATAAAAESPAAQDMVLGLADGLRGWRQAPRPKSWNEVSEKIAAAGNDDLKRSVQELSVVFGDGRAIGELRSVLGNGNAPVDIRRQALRGLLAAKPADLPPVLQNLLNDRALQFDAIRGLAVYDHPDTPRQLLDRLANLSPEARQELVSTLSSRPAYAKALLSAVRAKRLSASEISAFHARQILSFDDPELSSQLTELWGNLRASAADKRALIDQYKTDLAPEKLTEADASAGRQLFQKTCANCHVLYGVGRKLGPDLTGSNRKNLDYLLENVVDPSASVGADFRAVLLTLSDGRVLSGVVSEQNERTLTLQTPTETVTIDRQDIEATKQSPNSLMPDGLLQNLSPAEVGNLVAYLTSINQVPLPE